jgi:ferric-dicitrate binding protein FerR (iron transport regulator)
VIADKSEKATKNFVSGIYVTVTRRWSKETKDTIDPVCWIMGERVTRALITIAMLMIGLLSPASAQEWAGEWTLVSVRGGVVELVGDAWQPRALGDTIAGTHVIQTLAGSTVWLKRGADTVILGPDTKVQILGSGRDDFTTIGQHFGEVTIEAAADGAARHFNILTPHMAAAVSGGVLTVLSDEQGSSVEVQRGAVGILSIADLSGTTIHAGQAFITGVHDRLAIGAGDQVMPENGGHPAAEADVAQATEEGSVHAAADDHGA